MKHTWERNQNIVDKVNILWQDSQRIWEQLEAKRGEAASALNELLTLMTDAAKRSHDTVNIRLAPMVEKGTMAGLRVWIDNVCHIFKLKEESHGKNETASSGPDPLQLDGGEKEKRVRKRQREDLRENQI